MTPRRIVLLLAGVVLLSTVAVLGAFFFVLRHRTVRFQAAPEIVVQGIYRGASASVVADTVAAPIEQQVNGVEHLVSLASRCRNDGSYQLTIRFEAKADLEQSQKLVRERLDRTASALPDQLRKEGLTVRQKPLDPVLWVGLTSPERQYDEFYLGNYANLRVKEELARLPGVGDVVLCGEHEIQMEVWLATEKLAALELTAQDVIERLGQQNIQVERRAASDIELIGITSGRLADSEAWTQVVLTVIDGRVIRLGDVASVGYVGGAHSSARIDNEPAVLLGIQPRPGFTPDAVRQSVLDKLAELRSDAPDRIEFDVAVDFTACFEAPYALATPEHLVVDLELPAGLSIEGASEVIDHYSQAAKVTSGVEKVVALTRHPFSLEREQPGLIVILTPRLQRKRSQDDIAANLRRALHDLVPTAAIQISVPSALRGIPLYGYTIELVVEDRAQRGSQEFGECADALVRKMQQSGQFEDATIGGGLRQALRPQIEIDRDKCRTMGVSVFDVYIALQLHAQAQVTAKDIEQLSLKNDRNESIPLSAVVRGNVFTGPAVMDRHNLYPAARITANLAPGISLREAKALCETLAKTEFGKQPIQLHWIR